MRMSSVAVDNDKRLTLVLAGTTSTFASVAEFEMALEARCGLPVSRVAALKALPSDQLLTVADAYEQSWIRTSEASIDGAYADEVIQTFFRETSASQISQDHHWRSIFSALRGPAADVNPYRKAAIEHYTAYLAACFEAARELYRERLSATLFDRPVEQRESDAALVDLTTLTAQLTQNESFSSLSSGVSVDFHLTVGQILAIRLADHDFYLAKQTELVFVDSAGRSTALKDGSNVIGRDMHSDVVVSGEYRGVSRKHLVIKVGDGSAVNLTDLSATGTSVARPMDG